MGGKQIEQPREVSTTQKIPLQTFKSYTYYYIWLSTYKIVTLTEKYQNIIYRLHPQSHYVTWDLGKHILE